MTERGRTAPEAVRPVHLQRRATMTSIVSEVVLTSLQSTGAPPLRTYARALVDACDAQSPVYGMAWYGIRYRALGRDADWFVNSLVANAEREGYGAERIWQFANLVSDEGVARGVRNHSIDEAKHSRMFVRLIELIFPTALDQELRDALWQLSPGYTQRRHPPILPTDSAVDVDAIADEVIQINLVEVRSLMLQLLLRPLALAYCPPSTRERSERILERLRADEVRHIAYSARAIEGYAEEVGEAYVLERMQARMRDLNAITADEVERECYQLCGDCTGCSRSQALLAQLPSRSTSTAPE